MSQYRPLQMRNVENVHTNPVVGQVGGMQQQRMDSYLVDIVESLGGREPKKARAKLLKTTYELLKKCGKNPGGHSAGSLAEQMCEKSPVGSGLRLVPWVRRCLSALEMEGLAYRTYDDNHFLATNSELSLDDSLIFALLDIDFAVPSSPAHGLREGDGGVEGSSQPDHCELLPKQSLRQCRHRGIACGNDVLRPLQCAGRMQKEFQNLMWSRALSRSRKARIFEFASDDSQRGSQVCSVEYIPSGEYLLSANGTGRFTVFKCSAVDFRLRDKWDDCLRLPAIFPVREVPGVRNIDVAHWNPANRNEIGTCARTSGDIHTFDMKRCGTSSHVSMNKPNTIYTHKPGQGQGGVLDFSFVSNLNMIVAGTSGGTVMLWDTRASRTPKMTIKQRGGGLCFTQILSDGYTLVGGSTEGFVHLWDLRAARQGMSCMNLGRGKDDGAIFSVHIDSQLPVLNADGEICEGKLGVPSDTICQRSFALESGRELQLGFSMGGCCVGILNLLSRKVSHIYLPRGDPQETAGQNTYRRRLAWLSPSSAQCTLVHGSSDGQLLLFDEAARGKQRQNVWDELTLMEGAEVKVPGEVSCLASHPSDPSLAMGLRGSLWAMSFGQGEAESLVTSQ